jgi:hypothetical protein
LPPGATLDLPSRGCVLYLQENAVAELRSGLTRVPKDVAEWPNGIGLAAKTRQ